MTFVNRPKPRHAVTPPRAGISTPPEKELAGAPVLIVGLGALIAWMVVRIFTQPEDHALRWRVPLDLEIYRMGGQALLRGENLYDKAYIFDLPFTYPPFAGVLFTSFAYLADNALIILWQIGMLAALAAIIALVFRERGFKLTPLTLLVCALLSCASIGNEAVHGTLFFGQINIFLMLLVALDILPARRRLPGIGIGIAAGLKLTPAYMGLVLLFQKRWWAAVISVLTFFATVIIGFAFVPDARHFWEHAMFDSSRVGSSENTGSKSVLSVMQRTFGLEGGTVWILSVIVIFVFTCLALRTAMLRNNRSMAFALTGISSCLVSPFSWYHHFVWLVPLSMVLFIAVNEWAADRFGASFNGALAGLASLAAIVCFHIPFVSYPVWRAMSSRGIDELSQTTPWLGTIWTTLCLLFIVGYAIFGFMPRGSGVRSTSSGPKGIGLAKGRSAPAE